MAKTDGSISELTKQMSQLATAMSTLTNEPGRLPSQTIQNPKANISMIRRSNIKAAREEAARSTTYKLTNKHFTRRHRPDWNQEEDRPNDGRTWVTHADNGRYAFTVSMTPPPVTHFNIPASGWANNEGLDPDGLRSGLGNKEIGAQDSSCPMKFIASKDFATQKNKKDQELKGPDYTNPKPRDGQNGPIMERSLTSDHESQPEKDKDPGAFTVTCSIGETRIHKCLIDLGAAVNAMPYSLYYLLGLGPLKPPRSNIELGDKSCIQPAGVLEDLILHVGELVVAADFYVIHTGETSKDSPPTLILGRPFLYDTKAWIDVGKGVLSLAFGGKISDFYIDDYDGRPRTTKPPNIVPISDLSTQISDLPRETVRAARPAAMVKGPSPSQKQWKEKSLRQRNPNPSISSHKNSGMVKARINAGAVTKFDLSHPWDPNQ